MWYPGQPGLGEEVLMPAIPRKPQPKPDLQAEAHVALALSRDPRVLLDGYPNDIGSQVLRDTLYSMLRHVGMLLPDRNYDDLQLLQTCREFLKTRWTNADFR